MSNNAVEWTTEKTQYGSVYDRAVLGRVVVIIWTGMSCVDPDGGQEVCDAYVPTTDREFVDGLMLVKRRAVGVGDRSAAKSAAIDEVRASAICIGRQDLLD
jgi:hypothetical protein